MRRAERGRVTQAGALLLLTLLPLPWACGGDDAGKSSLKQTPDASADSGDGSTADVVSDVATESTSDGAAGGDGAADAADTSVPIDAQAALYSLELGGQVDQLLTSQHPGDPAVSYAIVSGPTLGKLLHLDTGTGRFVYSSIALGQDSFDFSISKDGVVVDSASITLTTTALDFVGDWHLYPGGGCADYPFSVTPSDAGSVFISPLVSACLKASAGMSIGTGSGGSGPKVEPQALGTVSCVTDIANVNYCYAFRFWRISSRGHFQSIETVSGTKTIGGTPYLISGSVRGIVRRKGDTDPRAAVAAKDTPIVQVGVSNGATKVQTLTLENKGALSATLGDFDLPAQVTMAGGYPGGGTCGATLDPGKTCTVMLTITPTAPATGTSESVPLSIQFSDTAGYDITRLSVNWSWQ